MSDPISNTFLTQDEVRSFLRDNDPSENLLLDDLEFGPQEITDALTSAIDYWNEVPPAIQAYDYNEFPYRYHLKIGACAQLLRMAANRFRRNELNYSIPGGGVSDQSRAPAYDAAADKLWTEYRKWVTVKKYELNTEQGWGSI